MDTRDPNDPKNSNNSNTPLEKSEDSSADSIKDSKSDDSKDPAKDAPKDVATKSVFTRAKKDAAKKDKDIKDIEIARVVATLGENEIRTRLFSNAVTGRVRLRGAAAVSRASSTDDEKQIQTLYLSENELGIINKYTEHRHIIRVQVITLVEDAIGINTDALTSIPGAHESEFLGIPCKMQYSEFQKTEEILEESDFKVIKAKTIFDKNEPKNIETQQLELLIKKMIEDFNSVTVQTKKNPDRIIFKVDGAKYDLGELLKKAQFGLIKFNKSELDKCAAYTISPERTMNKGAYGAQTKTYDSPANPQDVEESKKFWIDYFDREINEDKKNHPNTKAGDLHLAHKLAVNVYTTEFYRLANALCRDAIPQILNDKNVKANPNLIKDLLIETFTTISGIAENAETIKWAVRYDKPMDRELLKKKLTTDSFDERSLLSMAQGKSSYIATEEIIAKKEAIRKRGFNTCSYVYIGEEPNEQNIRAIFDKYNIQTKAAYLRYENNIYYASVSEWNPKNPECTKININAAALAKLDNEMFLSLKSKLSSRSVSEQFQNDIQQVKNFISPINTNVFAEPPKPDEPPKLNLFTDPSKKAAFDPSYSARQDIMRRILTLFSETSFHSDQDTTVTQAAPLPIASVLTHEGSILIQVPPTSPDGPKPNALFETIFGVAPDSGSPLLMQAYASHSLAINENNEVSLTEGSKNKLKKPKQLKTKDSANLMETAPSISLQFAMNLGIGHDGAKPANGSNGYLRANWLAPTKDSPGGLMIRIEAAAPSAMNPYDGKVHENDAERSELSVTGGEKFTNPKFSVVESAVRINFDDNIELKRVLKSVQDNQSVIIDRLDQPVRFTPIKALKARPSRPVERIPAPARPKSTTEGISSPSRLSVMTPPLSQSDTMVSEKLRESTPPRPIATTPKELHEKPAPPRPLTILEEPRANTPPSRPKNKSYHIEDESMFHHQLQMGAPKARGDEKKPDMTKHDYPPNMSLSKVQITDSEVQEEMERILRSSHGSEKKNSDQVEKEEGESSGENIHLKD